jgi:hypothetical protein
MSLTILLPRCAFTGTPTECPKQGSLQCKWRPSTYCPTCTEMFPGFRLDPAQVTEPNLILAGDIADPSADEYRLFLGHCSQLFERVFVILGNHEMWLECGGKPHRPHVTCATLCRTYLLTRSHFDVGSEVRIIGTTLWSKIPRSEAFSVDVSSEISATSEGLTSTSTTTSTQQM